MIDIDKYKAEPYEIEQSVLEALPMKDMVELTSYINQTFKEIMDIMNIHKANIDKVKVVLKGSTTVPPTKYQDRINK